jgi:phosphoribosyl 1,2-cyclic phosphate phosphodiesterase
MRLLFMGTGTSHGVPMIGCSCPVCTSPDPRNRRTRSSLLVTCRDKNILIDTATELRLQALAANVTRVDAVLYTHFHADHVFGFDDLRRFNQLQGAAIPVYGNVGTIAELKECFAYVFRGCPPKGCSKPRVIPRVITGPFQLFGLPIQPIEVYHGELPILGYRLADVAYITDCSSIPPSQKEFLHDLDVLILGALRYEPHPTHFNLTQALQLIDELKPRRAWLTHMTHAFDHAQVEKELPGNVRLAYDGLTIEA